MKKWMYVIFPALMLGGFLLVYTSHVEEAEAREKARIEKVEADRKEAARLKKEAELRAQVDAQKRQQEREEEERKKEEERVRKQQAADKELRDAIAQFRGEADKSAKQASELEIELDRLHKVKDQTSREDFELAKQVELARVAKRNAELQQQHLTAMLSQRAGASGLAKMPPPPVKK
ncbi:hypothetical protein [Opitutus sp. ER46]|uniref:hypothetical protein n=1 Tax=Opitutus sp. ER46 TaxID=2161864 RepID=UPI000D324B6B|nr:hypothetical protein [Opitutus sp. ER46]PTX96473.1 hypothetical protein DB354_07365 [Opitutus sp. ER46]